MEKKFTAGQRVKFNQRYVANKRKTYERGFNGYGGAGPTRRPGIREHG